jgi:hypothetical protein
MTSLAVLPVSCSDTPRVSTLTREWIDECVAYTADYLHQLSGGQYQFTWQVYDWFQLPMTSAQWNAGGFEVFSTAGPLVEAGLNVDLSGHTHFAFVIDKADGRAGAWHKTKPYLHIGALDLCPAILQHELGHMANAKHAQAFTGSPTPAIYGDSFCIMGGESNKFRFVEPSLDFRWRLGQPEWRRCVLCSALYFGGNPTFSGVCPGATLGAGHQSVATDYVVAYLVDGPGDFRYCTKCAAMFRARVPGNCPAGGSHNPSGWFFTMRPATEEKSLPEAQRQRNWFSCGKCETLFLDDPVVLRQCSAGGNHTPALGEGVMHHSSPSHNLSGPGMTIGNLMNVGWVKPAGGLDVSAGLHRRPWSTGFQIDALTTAPAAGSFAFASNVADAQLRFEYRHPSGWDRALPLAPDATDGWVLMHTATEQITTMLVAKMPAKVGQTLYLEQLQAHVNIGDVTATDVHRHVTINVETLDPPPNTQLNWRHCRKCRCLHYSGFLGKGPCAQGGEHELTGPNFAIPHDVNDAGQQGWRFCRLCMNMFFAGDGSIGRCVDMGKVHSPAGFDFAMPQDLPGRIDGNWRRCANCECMVHIGRGAVGSCAGGGLHQPTAIPYTLPMPRPAVDFGRDGQPLNVREKTTNPAPWIDKVNDYFDNAATAGGIQKFTWMHDVLEDAAYLYDEILRAHIDSHGPQLISGVIKGLALIGVGFSVPEREIRDWLANPLFTPYPALAQALLLSRRRLNKPIFIDVISAKYESQPGATPIDSFADVQIDTLEAALVAAWNENFGDQVADVGSISTLS